VNGLTSVSARYGGGLSPHLKNSENNSVALFLQAYCKIMPEVAEPKVDIVVDAVIIIALYEKPVIQPLPDQ
jgi:hypothetical protein